MRSKSVAIVVSLYEFYEEIDRGSEAEIRSIERFIFESNIMKLPLVCQGRTKTASVGRSKSTSGTRVVLAACRGSARGISPSLFHGVLNVAEQRTEQSYPGSVGG